MITFLVCLALLVAAYFTYGRYLERLCGADAGRPVPSAVSFDGVDYIPMPMWKTFLVQLLNIPKNLPVTGLMSLPGDGQMAILFPLVDTELLLQFLDKLLGLACRDELERIYRVSQQQDFRRLQFPIS